MNIETWRVALDSLRANKVKAFLTMLGVVIGSACIVLVVTVALTGKRLIIAQIEGIGANIVYAQVVRSSPGQLTTISDDISMADMEAMRAIPGVVDVGGTRQLSMSVVVGGIERPVNMVGITEGFQSIRRLQVVRGRALDTDDMAARSKVCLLTEELTRVMFPFDDPIGKSVRVGELTFTVVGVFRERVSTFGQSEIQRESVVISMPLMRLYDGQDFVRFLYAQAAAPQDVPGVTRQVAEVLKSRHRAGAVYLVENLTALLDAAGKISIVLTVVLLLVAFIALTISGIGIMNIMLVTVTERTREIGIRKAIGARNREILQQFLLESFIISGIGAVTGIVIAVSLPVLAQAMLRVVPSLMNVDLGIDPASVHIPISWLSVIVAFLVTCLTGILFGYLPANKAAKLQPTESLRYE